MVKSIPRYAIQRFSSVFYLHFVLFRSMSVFSSSPSASDGTSLPPTSESSAPESPRAFRRALGVRSSTMLVVGSMIGSGVFIVSADIARTVGSPLGLMLVWLATGALTLIAALSYGELAGMMPEAGGQYVYLREAYGPLIGFLYGWALFFVIQTGTIAAVAVAFAKFTAELFPALSSASGFRLGGAFTLTASDLVAIGSIVALTLLNARGVRGGKIVQDIFTVAKILGLLGLIAAGLIAGANAEAVAANIERLWDFTWTHWENGAITSVQHLSGWLIAGAFGAAMVGSIFSSDAWNSITFAAGEVVNPKRTIPLSLFLGTALVTGVYLLANLSYLLTLPIAGTPNGISAMERGIQFAAEDRVGTAVASVALGENAAGIMAALIMISTFGCNNGLILSGARVFYAMGKDGLFFRKAASLNLKGAPAFALVLQAAWASALCLSGAYSDLLDYVVFAILLFYVLTIGGIFVLRKRRPDAPRPYKAFGYPILPALYILTASAICVNLLIFKPAFAYPGLVIVLSGIPAYFLWKRFASSSKEA